MLSNLQCGPSVGKTQSLIWRVCLHTERVQHGPIIFVLSTLNCSIYSQCLGQDHELSGPPFNQEEGPDLTLLRGSAKLVGVIHGR